MYYIVYNNYTYNDVCTILYNYMNIRGESENKIENRRSANKTCTN